jgi:uncharacterized protein (TIGR02217 family)
MTSLFLEERLDPMVSLGCTSTVQFSRTKIYSHSGRLTQRFNWSNPKHAMDLAYRARPRAEYQTLLDFFYVVLANGYCGFRVKDWSNYLLDDTNSTLTLISGTSWQIHRRHTVGAYQYLRKITKIDPASFPVINRTRGGITSDCFAGIDVTTGIATISGHIDGDTYTAVAAFDVPMTFVDDAWVSNLEVTAANLWLSPHPILLEEVPL